MKLKSSIGAKETSVDSPTEALISRHFGKLTEGDFLILDNPAGEFVQARLDGEDEHLLEYQADGVQFSSDLELVSRAIAESAFVAFLLHGPNGAKFQSNCVWVTSIEQPKFHLAPATSLDPSTAWAFPTSLDNSDPGPVEKLTGAELALQNIAECIEDELTILDLSNCELNAVPAKVDQLVWLKSLYIAYNHDLGTKANDLSAITTLVNLRTLNTSNTQVSDLWALSGLVNLRWLNVSGTKVTDLTPLAGLTNLRMLNMSGTPVTDLEPLAGLANVQKLEIDMSHTPVTNLTPLAGLGRLKSLTINVSNTPITDLGPLAGLSGVKALSLDLSKTQITNLKPLAALVNLTYLNITDTLVADLTPLAGLTGLRTLAIAGEPPIDDLDHNSWPFAGSMQPKTASSTPITDLSPLAGLLGLKVLDISGTQVCDVAPLAGLVGLEELNISGTQVSDIAPLVGLVKLETLDVSRTQVHDTAPLANLVSLRHFTPRVGDDDIPRHQYRKLEAISQITRMSEGKKLAQIAKELSKKASELGFQISMAQHLLQQHDPYPRNAPFWERPAHITEWPVKLQQNEELVLHKIDLVYKVLAASARWKEAAKKSKLQLHFGVELPLPDYLLDHLVAANLTKVSDLLSKKREVWGASGFVQEDLELLVHYLGWYGLKFEPIFSTVSTQHIEDSVSRQSISELELTTRPMNCLLAENILTIGELVRCSEADLLQMPNLRRKSINEIREVLATRGLHLAGDVQDQDEF